MYLPSLRTQHFAQVFVIGFAVELHVTRLGHGGGMPPRNSCDGTAKRDNKLASIGTARATKVLGLQESKPACLRRSTATKPLEHGQFNRPGSLQTQI